MGKAKAKGGEVTLDKGGRADNNAFESFLDGEVSVHGEASGEENRDCISFTWRLGSMVTRALGKAVIGPD
jgi:hypothetical protein